MIEYSEDFKNKLEQEAKETVLNYFESNKDFCFNTHPSNLENELRIKLLNNSLNIVWNVSVSIQSDNKKRFIYITPELTMLTVELKKEN